MIQNRLPAVHPGEYLGEILEELHLTPAGLAGSIGVPETRITHILAGEARVTAALALRLGRALEQTPQYWLNLQADFDLKTAEARMGARLASIHSLVSA